MDLSPPVAFHSKVTPQAQTFFGNANFLVAKLSDYCNLRCKYCHQDALNGKPVLIPMETFKNAVRMILKPSRAPKVYVQFHGGEPLLCPDEFFIEAVEWCRQELETFDRRVEFFIQTNLTKVTPEKEKLLRDLKIGISFSMDGPPKLNDELRGGGRRIEENWRRMNQNGTEAGTICLIQPSNWDRMGEVLEYFHNEQIHNVRFNLMVPDGRGKEVDLTSTEKLFNAKKIVLDYMLETDGQSVVDATLYNAMKRFMKPNGAPSSFEYHGCEALYCQAGRTLYSINPDGKFFACDRIAEAPAWAMGNVNQPFGEKELDVATKTRKGFHHKDDWWARCEGCDAKKICEFSCSAYYVDKTDTREVECAYTKAMWGYFLHKKEEIRGFLERGIKPLSIDEKRPLQEQAEENWVIKDIAADAAYSHLSLVGTLAANRHYQLTQRGEQFYVYAFKRDKIFEVDALVAEIAQFNGVLNPELIAEMIAAKYETGQVAKALDGIAKFIPEILFQANEKGAHTGYQRHADHLQQMV